MEKDQKLQQIQFIEQNLQTILMQKQAFQMEISETTNALKQIEDSKEGVYKIIGQLMIKIPLEKVKEELKTKKKMLETQMKVLESQEKKLTEQATKIREDILKDTSKKELSSRDTKYL